MLSRDEILAIYQAGPEAMVALVEQLLATQATLEQQVTGLTARVTELEARLNKDSHNSHQPPSSDGPAKRPRRRSLRQRSGKKSGGQAGHPRLTPTLVDDPDVVLPHVPTACAECGASLESVPEAGRERRQIIDIPKPRPEVTEHQAVQKACPMCQTVTAGEFPPEVAQPVQYGPRTKAAAVYLQTYQLLPYERTVEALGDLFGVYPSEGTLTSAQGLAYTRLAPVEQAIQDALRRADVAHVDETGIRVAGRTEWVHVMSTALLTFYAHHAKRGREAFEAIGLLIDFCGRRVHDAWARFLNEVLQANPPSPLTGKRGRPKQTPARNLLDRLGTHRQAILAFMHDFTVPFDNNQADRHLPMLNVKQKVSGCFRSPEGAAYFCRIRGYISTLRKHGYSILDGLTSVFAGQPYMPRLEA